MKLAVPSFLASSHSKKKAKSSGKRPSLSASQRCGDASFSSSSSEESVSSSSRPHGSPRSVLDKISPRELEAVLRRLGHVDEGGVVSVAELEELGAALERPTAEAELWEAFTVFDADGDGKISAEELLGFYVTLLGDDGCTLEDCRRMIGGVDSDGDGYVCFEDFARMMDGQR